MNVTLKRMIRLFRMSNVNNRFNLYYLRGTDDGKVEHLWIIIYCWQTGIIVNIVSSRANWSQQHIQIYRFVSVYVIKNGLFDGVVFQVLRTSHWPLGRYHIVFAVFLCRVTISDVLHDTRFQFLMLKKYKCTHCK